MLQGRKSKLAEQRAQASTDEDGLYTGTPRVTSRVGADLRSARERVGWTLPAVAAHLRIRLPFLEAIEDGRIGDLPGNAYAVGFLRTYAQALGLDPDEIARRFKAEAAEVNRKTELTFPAPVPERGVPAGAVVLLGAVIAIGAYVGWYRMSGRDRPSSDLVQTVPERLAPLAASTAPTAIAAMTPQSGAPLGASSAPSGPSAGSPSGPPATLALSSLPPAAGTAPSGPVLGPPVPAALQAQMAAAATNVPMPPLPLSQIQSGAVTGLPDGTRIVLRAKSDAWMQVREKQGPVLLNRVLRSGETWPVPPGKSQLLLTTGNAAGTELLVDGATAPPLGGDGAVRRDLPLDPEMIRDGKLALGPSPAAIPSRPGVVAATRTN